MPVSYKDRIGRQNTGLVAHRRWRRGIGGRLGAFLSTVCLLGALITGITSEVASAETNFAGSGGCPHGFNSTTWASDACEQQLANNVNASLGNSTGSFAGGNTDYRGFYLEKVTMVTGNPCNGTAFIEGGFDYDYTGFVEEYIQYEPAGGSDNFVFGQASGGNLPGGLVGEQWIGGNNFNVSAFNNLGISNVNLNAPASCVQEAGSFLSTQTSNGLANSLLSTQSFSGLSSTNLSTGGVVHSWNNFVIDNPCGNFGNPGFPSCMNGVYYNNNNFWQEN